MYPASVVVFLALFASFYFLLRMRRTRTVETEQDQSVVRVEIKLFGDGFPSVRELKARHEMEDFVHAKGLGRVIDAGSGMGVMDIAIATNDVERIESHLRGLASRLGMAERMTINRR